MSLLNKHTRSTVNQMNDPNNRTFLDMRQWNKHIGKTYYELHPERQEPI